MTKRITKRDIVFLLMLVVVLCAVSFVVSLKTGTSGNQVEIQVDGEVYGIYSLTQDQEIPIEIDGQVTNILKIENGTADMIEADCPDQLCVHQRAISKANETIVCLPHKVVVQVISDTESEFDSIAK
ncbi:MAG: NusG domain II-containing protein [Roseburia sp.]